MIKSKKCPNCYDVEMDELGCPECGQAPDEPFESKKYSGCLSLESDEELSNRKKKKILKQEARKIVYDNGGFKIVKIGGDNIDPDKAAEVAVYYAKGTHWGTYNKRIAKAYLPLYVLFYHGNKVAQFTGDGSEMCDINAHSLFEKRPKFSTNAGHVQGKALVYSKPTINLRARDEIINHYSVTNEEMRKVILDYLRDNVNRLKILRRYSKDEGPISRDLQYKSFGGSGNINKSGKLYYE